MKLENIEKLTIELQNLKITTKNNNILEKLNTTTIKDGLSLYDLLKRPEITYQKLKENNLIFNNYDEEVIEQVELDIKYGGYILKAQKEAEKLINLENKPIPEDIDYYVIPNLASEAKQKLSEIRPTSIGQAIRISGVNPADISILSVYLKKEYNYGNR